MGDGIHCTQYPLSALGTTHMEHETDMLLPHAGWWDASCLELDFFFHDRDELRFKPPFLSTNLVGISDEFFTDLDLELFSALEVGIVADWIGALYDD